MMKKEISFWKTQWYNILWGVLFLVLFFVNFFRLALINSTEIATVEVVKLAFLAGFDLTLVILYVFFALINYNTLKVEQLAKRIEMSNSDVSVDGLNSYIGYIKLNCPICHKAYFAKLDDIIIDEISGLCEIKDIGKVCDHCFHTEGFEITGQIVDAEEEN